MRNVKGTSGNAQFKGLGMAYRLFRAPFPLAVIGTEEVKLAALRPADTEAVPEEEAHAGVFIQCWMEERGGGARRRSAERRCLY